MPPGENLDDFCTMLWSGMLSLNWKLSKEGKKRFFTEFLPLLHDTKLEVLGKDDDNSWYLVYIGTKPGSRGKGYAKALIEYTTQQVSFHPQTAQTKTRPVATICPTRRNCGIDSGLTAHRRIRKIAQAISNAAIR